MPKYGSHIKFQSLCKQILERSNKANFERIIQKVENILDERPDHEKLKDWFLKQHVFYKFKGAESNSVSGVLRNRTYLSVGESTLDDIAEFMTIK